MIALVVATGFTTAANAHGFGERYDLPLPLSLYLWGVAAAVAVTFVIVGLFVRDVDRAETYPQVDLLARPLASLAPGVALALRLLAVILLLVTILAGFWGNQNPYRNIGPTLVWIIGWVGLAYVSAFIGNLWAVINPWRTIFGALEWFYAWITHGDDLSLRLPYPRALGVWPAVVLLLAFSWIELIYPNPAVPSHIAVLLIAYSLITFAGMLMFGRDTWLAHGEVFNLVFGTFARFAPMDVRPGPQRRWTLRPFGAGLTDGGSVSSSMTAFVLLLLASVLYDGILGTPEWTAIETAVAAVHPAGGFAPAVIRTLGLIGVWLIFLGAYVAICALMSAVTGRLTALAMARTFAFTLVPIAIGYHLAHYLTFLLVQGQYIIPLVSDPFGWGWNLFGTAGYRVDIAIVGARFSWYAAVLAILLGHIAAVYLAHRKAMRVLGDRVSALRSQVPLTALMVVYTFISLSILAEPIVERRTPALPEVATEITVPDDAVLPDASGRLQPVGPGKVAKQKLTYRVLGSAFHDGTRTNVADLLYSLMFAYRWSADDGDAFVASATAALRRQLMGIRVLGIDATSKSFRIADVDFVREVIAVEIYGALPPVNPEQDAAIAPPWSTLPWHLIVLMEEAVKNGLAAFSQAEAARRGVDWLDLVRSEAAKTKLAALVERFQRDGYRPEALESLVSVEDARRRWAALAAFYKAHGHFLVSNGPYRLKAWSAQSVTLEAFRDLTYPLGVGSYDSYAVPRRGFVTKVERQNERVRLFADIELLMKHQRSYDLVRTPLQTIPREVLARSAPECRYTVVDEAGRVMLAGAVSLGSEPSFLVDLTGKLPSGRFTLLAQVIVNSNAMNADIARIAFAVAAP